MRGCVWLCVCMWSVGMGECARWLGYCSQVSSLVAQADARLKELEDDLLDRAWGLEVQSRLSCQAIVSTEDLTVEIPKYTINHAKENH